MKRLQESSLGLVSFVSLLSIACGEPIKSAQVIEEPRTLAVQVEGQDGTATPAAGEDAMARFLFAGSTGPQEVNLAYQICEAAESARGVPFCAGAVYAEGEIEEANSVAEVPFSIPEGTPSGTRLAILAVACPSSTPRFAEDPADWACSGPESPLASSFDVFVGGEESNANPDLSGLSVEVDGEAVELLAADVVPDCSDAVNVRSEEKVSIAVNVGELAQEEGEWLQVSHFASGGKYERQFSILEPGEDLEIQIEWEAPEEAEATKHYLVVRDDFGGVSFATWNVCVE